MKEGVSGSTGDGERGGVGFQQVMVNEVGWGFQQVQVMVND